MSGYFITVAASGERKSSSDDQAMWPINKHENKLRGEHESKVPQYLNDKLAWEKARDHITKRGKNNNRTSMKAALAPWEVPRRDPAERRPNAPEVVAQRRTAQQR